MRARKHGVNAGLNEEIDQSKVPTTGRRWDDFSLFVIRAILMFAIFLQIILGTDNGLTYARGWNHTLLVAGNVTVNIDKASDDLVKSTLFVGAADVGFIRQSAQIAKTRHLSLFATSVQAYYTKVGLLTELTDVHTRMINPLNGATLKGTCLLDAGASDMSGVTKVEYRLIDSATGRDTLIGVGKPTFTDGLYPGILSASRTAPMNSKVSPMVMPVKRATVRPLELRYRISPNNWALSKGNARSLVARVGFPTDLGYVRQSL